LSRVSSFKGYVLLNACFYRRAIKDLGNQNFDIRYLKKGGSLLLLNILFQISKAEDTLWGWDKMS
jgi:hypothetical protein